MSYEAGGGDWGYGGSWGGETGTGGYGEAGFLVVVVTEPALITVLIPAQVLWQQV